MMIMNLPLGESPESDTHFLTVIVLTVIFQMSLV